MSIHQPPPAFRVPFPLRFSNYLLRTPCIGTLFLIFYIYVCLPEGTSSGWFAAISIVISLLSFFTTVLTSFGTPIAFVVSLFFISDYNHDFFELYAAVTLVAMILFVLHYTVMSRLASRRYITLPDSGSIIVNPDWVVRHLYR